MLSFSIAYCHMLTLRSEIDFSHLEGKGNADSPSESLQSEHTAGSKRGTLGVIPDSSFPHIQSASKACHLYLHKSDCFSVF